jgi:hypothetical protein
MSDQQAAWFLDMDDEDDEDGTDDDGDAAGEVRLV